VRKAVLIGTLGPYLAKASDNVEGVDRSVFEDIKNGIRADRAAFILDFLKNFYNYDVNGGKLVSDRVLEDNWNVATGASAIGTLQCVDAWVEDFRKPWHGARRSIRQPPIFERRRGSKSHIQRMHSRTIS
jgi:non-heme chloroperoxidase